MNVEASEKEELLHEPNARGGQNNTCSIYPIGDEGHISAPVHKQARNRSKEKAVVL